MTSLVYLFSSYSYKKRELFFLLLRYFSETLSFFYPSVLAPDLTDTVIHVKLHALLFQNLYEFTHQSKQKSASTNLYSVLLCSPFKVNNRFLSKHIIGKYCLLSLTVMVNFPTSRPRNSWFLLSWVFSGEEVSRRYCNSLVTWCPSVQDGLWIPSL